MQRTKKSTNWFWKLGKAIIVAELAMLGGSYIVCKKLNEDRDFRFLFRDKIPILLEGYYWITTFGPDGDVKNNDLAIWRKEGKIK